MGSNKQTTTSSQTSGLTNPAFQNAATTLGNQLNSALNTGVKPYTESTVPALSGYTQSGLNALSNNPNNAAYMQGIQGAIGQQSAIANGQVVDDPVRQRALDDALTASNSVFSSNGRFGSGSHATNLAEGSTNALAGLDYARQQQAIQNLPALYGASQQPASAFLQAGQIQDAWNAASAEDRARVWDATNNAGVNSLQRLGSIFSGTAPVTGTTTTGSQTSPKAPWYTGLLGGIASIF